MKHLLISAVAGICFCLLAQGTAYALSMQEAQKQDDDKNAFLAKCTDSQTTQSRIDSFFATIAQSDKCIDTTRDVFLSHFPTTEARWYLHPTANYADDTHKATHPEGEDLAELMSQKNECQRAVMKYEGPMNNYVARMIQATKEYNKGFNTVMENYIRGKVSRGELTLKGKDILDAYNKKVAQIIDDNSESYEQKKTYCLAQYESPRHKQHMPGDGTQVAITKPTAPFMLGPSVEYPATKNMEIQKRAENTEPKTDAPKATASKVAASKATVQAKKYSYLSEDVNPVPPPPVDEQAVAVVQNKQAAPVEVVSMRVAVIAVVTAAVAAPSMPDAQLAVLKMLMQATSTAETLMNTGSV